MGFYFQHPEYLGVITRDMQLSSRLKERLALLVVFLVGQHYYYGRPEKPLTQDFRRDLLTETTTAPNTHTNTLSSHTDWRLVRRSRQGKLKERFIKA